MAGGTLAPSASSYLTRSADTELLEGLLAGEMCYVLNTRQMGKSSLMVRTAMRIREHGGHSILLDLTSFGQNLTADQWYLGMLCQMGELTDLQDKIIDNWVSSTHIGPMQRFIQSLRLLLEAWPSGPVVIFVDEIDAVRSLKFSTDEFFAAIRECHNRKSVDPLYQRLTFCLIGVAVPTDLIRDVNATPFNVGRRVVLSDFTFDETLPFLNGLSQLGEHTGRAVLERVLYWTGGQPYLTQKLCMEAIKDPDLLGPRDIDLICERVFFQQNVKDSDPNLSFAQNRMLNGTQERTLMLLAYRRARHGGFPFYFTDKTCEALLLSGLVKIEKSRLVVRNRIYQKAFDDEWIRSRMPDAEIIRQKAEYMRGLYRGFAISGIIAFAIFGLFFANVRSQKRAVIAEKLNNAAWEYNRHLAYDAQFQRLHDRVDMVGREQAQQVLQRSSADSTGPDLRRFEWYYLNRLSQQELRSLLHPNGSIECLAYSKSTGLLGSAGGGSVHFWHTDTGAKAGEVAPQFQGARSHTIAMLPDSPLCALPGRMHAVQLWDMVHNQDAGWIGEPGDHSQEINSIAVNGSGTIIAVSGRNGIAQLYRPGGLFLGRIPRIGTLPMRGIWSSAFLKHGTEIVFGCDDGTLRVFRVNDGAPIRTIAAHSAYIYCVAVSPDENVIATASGDGTTGLFNATNGTLIRRAGGHTSYVYTVAFSPDGRYVTSGGWDHLAQVWDLKAGNRVDTIKTNGMIWASTFTDNSNVLALGTSDRQIRLIDLTRHPVSASMENSVPYPMEVRLSRDGSRVAGLGRDGSAGCWDIETRKRTVRQVGNPAFIMGSISEDGKHAVAVFRDHWTVYDTSTAKVLLTHRIKLPGEVTCALSGDGRVLAEVGKVCTLYRVDNGAIQRIFAIKHGADRATLSADGSMLALYGDSLAPYILNVDTGLVQCGTYWNGPIKQAQFSDDSKHFTVVGHNVCIYDAVTGKKETDILDPFTSVSCASLSRDNSRLVTGGDDHMLRIWDVATSQIVLELPVDSWRVISVDISDDNKRIAASLDGQGVRVWDAEDFQQHGR